MPECEFQCWPPHGRVGGRIVLASWDKAAMAAWLLPGAAADHHRPCAGSPSRDALKKLGQWLGS